MKNTAIMLLSCRDSKGIVAAVTAFIYQNNGNIVTADQYTDFDDGMFFMRIEWELDGFRFTPDEIKNGAFSEIAEKFAIDYRLYFSEQKPNMAIFVSTQDHCLLEVLWRNSQNEFKGNVSCIISNHKGLKKVAENFKIPFYHVEKTLENKAEAEARELEILQEHDVTLVVLAKYMQILSNRFTDVYANRIINIHHSFLPAFEGARPYHRAHERGVKLIGATVHYVNQDLDRGPIIDQAVMRVSHKDVVADFIRKGRDLERLLLVRGIALHLDHRLLAYKNRTILFE